MPNLTPETWSWLLLGAATLACLVVAWRRIFSSPRTANLHHADGSRRSCLACGAPATEAIPEIRRGRGARNWLRELLAMPPFYKRVVPRDAAAGLCLAHAHAADAMVDEFLHARVRGAFAAAYTRVAVEAASFEQEFLERQLAESLTEEQQRARKRARAAEGRPAEPAREATVTRLRAAGDGSNGA